jgi:hypothetical protein
MLRKIKIAIIPEQSSSIEVCVVAIATWLS